MATILITGGSGLIGSALTAALLAKEHDVRHLTRVYKKVGPVRSFLWDVPAARLDPTALEGVDHIVHLAGAPIVDRRWSEARVKELISSRADSARLLLRTAQATGNLPKSFVSAAGIGYYGAITSDRIFSEDDPPAQDTIGRISAAWEEGVDAWRSVTRVVKLRTPIVLAREGGALKPLSLLARWGLASPLGSGKQRVPWVHIDDLVRVYQQAIDDERMSGAYNVVADEQPHQRTFMRTLAEVMHRPFILPAVPSFVMRMILGERAGLLLEGSRVSGEHLRSAGGKFQYPTLGQAVGHLLS
ncbi:MAG: TIGR01777 family protein [Flavobacteriales bacterium]|nr:TIGR01777 family protein [Flavobacteriales bacterium]